MRSSRTLQAHACSVLFLYDQVLPCLPWPPRHVGRSVRRPRGQMGTDQPKGHDPGHPGLPQLYGLNMFKSYTDQRLENRSEQTVMQKLSARILASRCSGGHWEQGKEHQKEFQAIFAWLRRPPFLHILFDSLPISRG